VRWHLRFITPVISDAAKSAFDRLGTQTDPLRLPPRISETEMDRRSLLSRAGLGAAALLAAGAQEASAAQTKDGDGTGLSPLKDMMAEKTAIESGRPQKQAL
jgi:hypothetical protein